MFRLYTRLCGLTVFRAVLQTPVLQALMALLRARQAEEAAQAYGELVFQLRQAGKADLGQYLWQQLCTEDAAFGRACALGEADAWMLQAAKTDLETINQVIALDMAALLEQAEAESPALQGVLTSLPLLPTGQPISLEALMESYRQNGVGLFAAGRAFRWCSGQLLPVLHPDPIDEASLIGYHWQREEVLQNTRALVQGRPANNVLLYGDSGTGKSATIKSLINIPEFYNLRLIEVSKEDLSSITELSRIVGSHTQKFILYIDDLSFEREDKGFSALKTALEGGLELRPENVAIYATSNRRHMVRESFSDRQGDEVHVAETIQERTSLSERFGLRIPYMSMGKQEFLDMVCQMADQDGLDVAPELLRREAATWEIQHGGRTPRIARQFVDFKLGS